VERASGQPPSDAEWRADALARSQHSRLDDLLTEPLQDHDAERAAAVCAEITRGGLQDFAPALVLLSPAERRRVQAVAAFGLTLFDFARQSSLEGEKLAQINRWSFDLESTLAGSPPGQPVFVLLADAHTRKPWPEEPLLELASRARRRALRPRAQSAAESERDSRRLAAALANALVPEATDAVVDGLAALLRVRRLVGLGEDRRRHQAGLARDEMPEEWEAAPTSNRELAASVRRECARLNAALRAPEWLEALPPRWRRAAGYAVLGARRLVRRCDALGERVLAAPPRLGALERLGLLLRARWARV
jgi:phytoene/squalene synthetase